MESIPCQSQAMFQPELFDHVLSLCLRQQQKCEYKTAEVFENLYDCITGIEETVDLISEVFIFKIKIKSLQKHLTNSNETECYDMV